MDLVKIIDEAILNQAPDEHRRYIGASSIGNDCGRSIWLSYNGVKGKPWTAKQRRTLEIGKRLEDMMLDYIELAGFKITRPEKGSNGIPCQDDEVPIFRGNMDGLLHLTDTHVVVLEIKTAKASEYKKFVDVGLKSWKPTYYAQLQSYMGMKKLKNAVIFVLNKDSSEWHCEWVEYDDIYFHELRVKALAISTVDDEPKKINENASYWICQMCKFKDVCHKPGEVIERAVA